MRTMLWTSERRRRPLSEYALDSWNKPRSQHGLRTRISCHSRRGFARRFQTTDADSYIGWEMTEAQRATWLKEILNKWDAYGPILQYDGTGRLTRQLNDMMRMGGGLVVIDQEYGMGKTIIGCSLLKMWQVMVYRKLKELHLPSMYWHRIIAKRMISQSPRNSAHLIDEYQDDSGSGSHGLIKHLLNMFKTIRKTGRFVTQAGLNIPTGSLGKAVALLIRPFGFNRRYQANRFIVLNHREEPLWMAITQRCFLPHEEVYYEGDLGTFAECDARAALFSTTTDGVQTARDADDEAFWMEELVQSWQRDYPNMKAPTKALTWHGRHVVKIPVDVEAKIEEIVSMAKVQIGVLVEAAGDDYRPTTELVTGEGWDVFRKELAPIVKDNAHLAYFVPRTPLESYPDIVSRLHPLSRLGKPLLPDSFGDQIRARRHRLAPKDIGDAGERALTSWLELLGAVWGGGGEGVPDVLCKHEGQEIAINAKTTLKDTYADQVATTPEDQWEHRAVVLLIPRRLEIRLFDIEASKTTINSRKGRLAKTTTLVDKLKEMMNNE